MFDIFERSYPHNNFIYRVNTEEEAIDATNYFNTIYKNCFYLPVTREQINHEANIFASSM